MVVMTNCRKSLSMKKLLLVGSGMLVLMTAAAALAASEGPDCGSFFYNADGSWSPTHPYMIAIPTSQTLLTPSEKLRPNLPGARGWVARYLNAQCRFEQSTVSGRRIPLVP
jgi:hypothetical protein